MNNKTCQGKLVDRAREGKLIKETCPGKLACLYGDLL
jgi:hypothetical protein